MKNQKKKEAWIVTVNKDSYYKETLRDCYGGGWVLCKRLNIEV